MTVNMFEGARRIVKVVAVLWAVGACAWVWMNEPYISLAYVVTLPDFYPVRMSSGEDCNAGDWREQNLATTGRGTSVSATFCLRFKETPKVESIRDPGAVTKTWVQAIQDPGFAKLSPTQQLAFSDEFFADQSGLDPGSPEFQDLRVGWREHVMPTLKISKTPVKNELFVLRKEDEEWADSEWWSERLKSMQQGLVFLAGGWVFMWVLTWVVGWIVRGFLGIPVGQDRRVGKG